VTIGDTAGWDVVVPATAAPHVVEPESPAALNVDAPVSAAMARAESTLRM
jgi:hypothetical protein